MKWLVLQNSLINEFISVYNMLTAIIRIHLALKSVLLSITS